MSDQPQETTPSEAVDTQPQAAAATPTPAIDVAAITKAVAEQVSNSVFASLRRAGVMKGAAQTEQTPPAAAQPDVTQIVQREIALARTLGAAGLSDAQIATVDKLFRVDNPPDVAAWANQTVASLGIGRTAPVAPSHPPSPRPSSDGGAPGGIAPPSFADEPWRLTAQDVERGIREKGSLRYGAEARDALKRALTNTRLSLPRPR